jgi:hypothetical protein
MAAAKATAAAISIGTRAPRWTKAEPRGMARATGPNMTVLEVAATRPSRWSGVLVWMAVMPAIRV